MRPRCRASGVLATSTSKRLAPAGLATSSRQAGRAMRADAGCAPHPHASSNVPAIATGETHARELRCCRPRLTGGPDSTGDFFMRLRTLPLLLRTLASSVVFAHGPSREKVTQTIEISAPAAKARALTADLCAIPHCHPALAACTPEGRNTLGAKRFLHIGKSQRPRKRRRPAGLRACDHDVSLQDHQGRQCRDARLDEQYPRQFDLEHRYQDTRGDFGNRGRRGPSCHCTSRSSAATRPAGSTMN